MKQKHIQQPTHALVVSSLTPVSFDVDTVYGTSNFHTTLLNDGKVALLSDGVAPSGSGYAVYLTVVDPITQTVVNRFNYPEANVVPAGHTFAYNYPRDVVQLKDGGIVITGVAINSTTGKYGVYATIVNTDGTVKVPPFMVDEAAVIFQSESISLLALDNGGFQVAYQDNVPTNTSVSNLKTSTFDVSGNLVQTGTTAGATDTFTGGDKGDTFTANGGADIILAGGGNDTVVINGDNITKLSQSNTMLLDGGSGINTLKISDSGSTLDLTDATIAAKVQGFNTIDLTGTGNNTLKLDPAAVARIATTDDNTGTPGNEDALMVVNGNTGDALQLAGTWTAATASQTGAALSAIYGSGYGFVAGTTLGGGTRVALDGVSVLHVPPTVAPVVLDLDRDGQIEYTQQLMDVNLDGQLDQSAWASSEDGVLVWDKFGTGEVKDLNQFAFTAFGGETDLQGLAAGFDSNADGVFDAKDAKFAEFGVWQDADGDGTADVGELRSLADVGIASIDLQSDGVARTPADGVTEAGRTEVMMTDGSSVLAADAAFSFQTLAVLDLTGVLKDGVADMADGKAELLKINLTDLLQLPTTADGQHVLQVNGDEVDAVELEGLLDGQPGTWSSTGAVTQNGHTYNVYQHSADPSLQVLIDQHIATSNVHSS